MKIAIGRNVNEKLYMVLLFHILIGRKKITTEEVYYGSNCRRD